MADDDEASAAFASSSTAFSAAREYSLVASYLEATLLDRAIQDARRAGICTVRAVAAALDVPKSTIARRWNITPSSEHQPLPDGTAQRTWDEILSAVWEHDQAELDAAMAAAFVSLRSL